MLATLVKVAGPLKWPAPSPNKTDTVPVHAPELAVARSCLPSPLKSPTATEKSGNPTKNAVAGPKLPVPSPNEIETVLELGPAVTRSCWPSPLKSPTATESAGLPKFTTPPAKLTGLQVAGVVTVRVKVLVAVRAPALRALTVTKYVPAGCASVTRTAPVTGFASSVPWKLVEVE